MSAVQVLYRCGVKRLKSAQKSTPLSNSCYQDSFLIKKRKILKLFWSICLRIWYTLYVCIPTHLRKTSFATQICKKTLDICLNSKFFHTKTIRCTMHCAPALMGSVLINSVHFHGNHLMMEPYFLVLQNVSKNGLSEVVEYF